MRAKKSKRGLLALLLVFLVVISSVFIGSLARFLTTTEVSDEAVVAKFGLNIPNTIDLFHDSYTNNIKAETAGKNIIAPGTFGQYKFSVQGTAEVAYSVSADISITYSDEWGDYKPLEFSLNGTDWTDFDQFKTALGMALLSNKQEPNTTYTNAQTIYWRWPFSVSSALDIKDTEMGSMAANTAAPKVTVNIKVTAAQIM
jgi:hypothetical protein